MGVNSRVFSEAVVGSEDFLFMQGMSQALYFRLCMTADDKGVVNNARTLVRSIGASEEHLQELLDLDFVIQIQDKPKLYVIKDWFVMNKPENYRGKESEFAHEIKAAVFVDECKRYRRLSDKNKYKHYQPQRSEGKSTKKLADDERVFAENSPEQNEFSEKLADDERVFAENSPEEKRREEKRKEEKRKEIHTPLGGTNANVCARDDFCDLPADLPATNTDPPPPSDPPVDDLSLNDPPGTLLTPKELENKAEEIRKQLKDAGLKVPDQISWWQRDFRFALEGKRRLKLNDEDFFGALENYATLLKARKANPAVFWWKSKQTIGSLFNDNGKEPVILRFLPDVFDLEYFKKSGEARASPKRGIDQSANYDAKAIAAKQAGDATVYENEDYTDIGF